MIALFNNQLTENQIASPFNDRALQFGDGLFETIKVKDGKVQLLDYHLRRLHLGASAIGLKIPDHIRLEHLKKDILHMMHLNHLEFNANVKLTVWRKNDNQRAYFSEEEHANTLLLTRNSSDLQPKNKSSFSEDIKLHYWKLSQFKTISALPYVMAARERDRRKLDELILLNVHDHITECTSSNIYWIKDEIIFTPSLKTGCIAGVMRAYLLDYFKENNIEAKEVEAEKQQLMEADTVFTSNSQGVQVISAIDEVNFNKIGLLDTVLADLDQGNRI
ncbi:MAG: aminotransferase class IV [Fulvivirga sp.]